MVATLKGFSFLLRKSRNLVSSFSDNFWGCGDFIVVSGADCADRADFGVLGVPLTFAAPDALLRLPVCFVLMSRGLERTRSLRS